MNSYKSFILIVLLLPFYSFGQSIQNEVLANSGQQMSNNQGSITFTIGEVMVDHYSQTNQLHQGFHQAFISVVETSTDEPDWATDISVYPNPTSTQIMVANPAYQNNSRLEIIDMYGRLIISNDISSSLEEIDLSALPDAIYLLRIWQGEKHMIYKVIKNSK